MLRKFRELFPFLVGVLTTYLLALIATRIDLALAKWAPVCVAVWFTHGTLTGWNRLGKWDHIGVFWGTLSSYNFILYLLHDSNFEGWGDVYFFCGYNHEYCSCSFHWNIYGWWKAFALWNFSIAFAFGLQKLALLLGLGGLLPGEEVVTRDSIVSVCWRLVPYWLNNWEQNWGTECSSMLFEVPRFAMELLVILPCVQIVAARLKILVAPQIHVVVSANQANRLNHDEIAVNIVKRHWEVDPTQKKLMRRLQANTRVMLFLVILLAFAAFNSLWVPLRLEQESLMHPRAQMAIEAGRVTKKERVTGRVTSPTCDVWSEILQESKPIDVCPANVNEYITLYKSHFEGHRGCCKRSETFDWALRKHAKELGRMKNFDHRRMIPLIEVTLAMMRLSCEKFFVLLTVYVNYLLFRKPPKAARRLVKINSTLSAIFQHVVLYTFPAICWVYGAGIIFSSFVSLIFWGGPLSAIYRTIYHALSHVVLKDSNQVTQEHIELMGGICSICWGPLELPDDTQDEKLKGISLHCRHAYHRSCLVQWTEQCNAQGRKPICPMCQQPLEHKVMWRLPWSRRHVGELGTSVREEIPQIRPVVEDDDFLFGDPQLQNMLEEMPDIQVNVVEGPGQVQLIIDRQELRHNAHAARVPR
eukprot:g5908.t1